MPAFIKKFSEINFTDLDSVGMKNTTLGNMFNQVSADEVVADGFAITSDAFRYFLKYNSIENLLKELISNLDRKTFQNLKETGWWARRMIMSSGMPVNLSKEIITAYKELCTKFPFRVAVRSSPIAEELSNENFVAQHETYLNITGESELIVAIKKCFASLYSDRAIRYREENRIAHDKVVMSVGIQKMVRSKLANSCTFNSYENVIAIK